MVVNLQDYDPFNRPLGRAAQPQNVTRMPPATSNDELVARTNQNLAALSRPDVLAGLTQFAVSVMQPRPENVGSVSNIFASIGDAGAAMGRRQELDEGQRRQELEEEDRRAGLELQERDVTTREATQQETTRSNLAQEVLSLQEIQSNRENVLSELGNRLQIAKGTIQERLLAGLLQAEISKMENAALLGESVPGINLGDVMGRFGVFSRLIDPNTGTVSLSDDAVNSILSRGPAGAAGLTTLMDLGLLQISPEAQQRARDSRAAGTGPGGAPAPAGGTPAAGTPSPERDTLSQTISQRIADEVAFTVGRSATDVTTGEDIDRALAILKSVPDLAQNPGLLDDEAWASILRNENARLAAIELLGEAFVAEKMRQAEAAEQAATRSRLDRQAEERALQQRRNLRAEQLLRRRQMPAVGNVDPGVMLP